MEDVVSTSEGIEITIEVPERWCFMSDEALHDWRVQRAKEKGESPPLTLAEIGERLGRERAACRERALLAAMETALVSPDTVVEGK